MRIGWGGADWRGSNSLSLHELLFEISQVILQYINLGKGYEPVLELPC